MIKIITSHSRGNKIYFDGKVWRYENGKVDDDSKPCTRCKELPTKEGFDACIGHIEGAKSACCGHGVEKPYVVY